MLTLVLLGTIGAWLGFANPIYQLPIAALAFPLSIAWIGLRATSTAKAFKFGWLTGLITGVGLLYWVVIPVQFYGGLPWYIALPCPVLLSAFMSVYYGIFSAAMYHAGQRIDGVPLCILAGLAWASMEMLMGSLLSGFPWMNLTSAFVPWPFAIQGASVIGSYGMSGVFAALAVGILLYSTYRSALVFAIGTMVVITAFGFYRIESSEQPIPDYTVSIVQGNVDQGLKWDPQYQANTVKKYVDLSKDAIDKHAPKVVIWPETAMPFYLQDRSPHKSVLTKFAKESKTSIITGSPAYRVIDLKTREYVLLNRAWLVDDLGRSTQSYDKEHLVPFGEYMPFAKWIPFEKLVQAAGDFMPGVENRPLMLDGVALGMLICYEGIFPELAQTQVARGASALVNISNDAWFGDTSAPKQHFNLTVLRAVEQGRWLVRSTNTGISAFIDPFGRVAAVGTQFTAENLSSRIAPLKNKTLFHQIYERVDIFIYVLTVLSFGWLFIATKRYER